MTATFLGIAPLGWVVIASTIFALGLLGLCALVGAAIYAGKAGGYPVHMPQEASNADLDDWLASEEPLEEFKLWKRPEAETDLDKADLRRVA